VQEGDKVEAGEPLTEGSLNPHTILRIKGRDACQLYLMKEIQQVYRTQGQNINDKHFEVIIHKMLGKVQVVRSGDSHYLPQDLVNRLEIRKINEELAAQGKRPARYVEILLGITKAALETDSFLSASSFQHTIKVLSAAAIASREDPLYGLKENIMIGKLIPAGTGFEPGQFSDETPGEEPTGEMLDGRMLNLFEDDDDVVDLYGDDEEDEVELEEELLITDEFDDEDDDFIDDEDEDEDDILDLEDLDDDDDLDMDD
jgi:DNA-directed RNA polymerase subunit beta'